MKGARIILLTVAVAAMLSLNWVFDSCIKVFNIEVLKEWPDGEVILFRTNHTPSSLLMRWEGDTVAPPVFYYCTAAGVPIMKAEGECVTETLWQAYRNFRDANPYKKPIPL